MSLSTACSRYATGVAAAALLLAATPYTARAQLGTNLIHNPGAEAGTGSADGSTVASIPGWTTGADNPFTVVMYGASGGFPSVAQTPPGGGSNLFAGGPDNPSSFATQTLALGPMPAGTTYTLSGYFGGFESQGDYAQLFANFYDAGEEQIGDAVIGNVTPADREGNSVLLFRSFTGTLPTGTTSVIFQLTSTRTDGSYNDGYADNLSFVLSGDNVTTTPEPGSLALLGTGLISLVPVVRRRRR